MSPVKLEYIGHMLLDDKFSPRLWNVLTPVPGYEHCVGRPTFTLEGLKERGLL